MTKQPCAQAHALGADGRADGVARGVGVIALVAAGGVVVVMGGMVTVGLGRSFDAVEREHPLVSATSGIKPRRRTDAAMRVNVAPGRARAKRSLECQASVVSPPSPTGSSG